MSKKNTGQTGLDKIKNLSTPPTPGDSDVEKKNVADGAEAAQQNNADMPDGTAEAEDELDCDSLPPVADAADPESSKPPVALKEYSFDDMLVDFGKFIREYPIVRSLNLKIDKIKPGHYTIYQGNLHTIWGYLRMPYCRFLRTSLLRSILNIQRSQDFSDWENFYNYFKNYNLTTGVPKND